ncbi:MAG: hypothetical protein M3Y72_22545 [Acidobacteriota bacterium]|nr:hypothetical protein [Acidobacteriota bacterium]MDQ2843766.1 hypothetical protein [Acidobacteriota bacterium]
MSTIQVTTDAHLARKRVPNSARDNLFFLAMSIACAVGVLVGFARTYYLRTYFASHALSLLFQIHGAVFTAWMIYFVAQTALIADRRMFLHRRLGYAGAVLASAMVLIGTAVVYSASKYVHFRQNPFTHTPEGTLFFSMVDILLFAVFVSAGFYFRRNRQVHQRLMLMATVCPLMPSALARLPVAGHLVALVNVLVFLFVLAGPLYDLLTLHRIHRAYLWSLLLFFFTVPPVRMLVGNSAAWYRVGHWLLS